MRQRTSYDSIFQAISRKIWLNALVHLLAKPFIVGSILVVLRQPSALVHAEEMRKLGSKGSSEIAAEIRHQIESGELAAGDRVPSTREIIRRWGVAMATASKVLGALKAEGLVRTRPGEGTVVAGPRPSRPRASVRVRDTDAALSKERIVAEATDVADKEGLGPLSMRRVAVELDVATMSLYRHVRDKDDLLNAMVDAAFAEWQMPPARAGIKNIARAQRT